MPQINTFSLYTGEKVKITVETAESKLVPNTDFEVVQDDVIKPRYDYTKADTRFRNLNACKGLNEL